VVQIRSRRSFRHPQQLADLTVRKAFHIMHDDHCPLPFGQCRQSRAKPPAQLILLGGIVKGRRQRLMQLIRVPNFPSPTYIECGVGDYAAKPSPKGLVRPESGKRSVSVQEAFLHGVLRVLSRERDCASDGECANLMASHKLREGVATPLLRTEAERPLALTARPLRGRRVI